MTALAVTPERITTMILLLLCGCSVVVTTTMAFQPTSMGSVLLSATSLSSPNKHSTQLLDAPVTDPVPVVPAEAVTATVPATTAAPPAAVTTTTTVTQADLGEVTELPNTYVSCGQCGAAYAITAEIMGRPRYVILRSSERDRFEFDFDVELGSVCLRCRTSWSWSWLRSFSYLLLIVTILS